MELSQIRYFLSLAETLNFTEAARRTGISQPSLTKSIRRLEEELGAPLVYRDGKDTRLTALGREMQGQFMRIDAQVMTALELAETTIAGRTRELKIGIAITIAPVVFSDFVAHLLDQLPSVEITIHQMRHDETEASVLSGRYDLCILPNPVAENAKLTCVPIFDEQLKLAMAGDHKLAGKDVISPEEITDDTYIDRLHCEFRSQLISHFMDRNIVMRPKVQSDREDWVQYLVSRGVGVCALPERSAMAEGLVLRPIEGLDLARRVSLVAISGSGNLREVRQLLDLARRFDWANRPDARA